LAGALVAPSRASTAIIGSADAVHMAFMTHLRNAGFRVASSSLEKTYGVAMLRFGANCWMR
jgi:hypothetical protein